MFRFFILFAATLATASAIPVPLPGSLDGAGLAWTTGGTDTSAAGDTLTPVWGGQTTTSQDGVDAARSPALVTPQAESWIQTTVTGPGTLSWQWSLELQEGDPAYSLEFLVGDDSFPRQILLENTAWTAASEIISAPGPVKVRWRVVRTFAFENASTNAAFVDTVSFASFGPPVFQSAAAINARGFTARWTALPAATEYTLEIGASADFSGSIQTISIPAPANSFVLTGLQPLATYHYRLTARGPEGLESVSAVASVTLPAIQRPANDAFTSATALSGQSGSVSGTTLDATVQTDEPASHQASVWFTWTAPGAGRWSFRATPTSETGLAPALFLYTGSSLGGLVEIASTQDGRLEFDTAAGVAYRLALDASAGAFNPEDAQGPLTLAWERLVSHEVPGNDAFANAFRLNNASGLVTGSNAYASIEAGEPASAGAGRTVWWRWTATATGLATFDASGSAITPTLAAYTGASLGSLSLVDSGVSTLAIPVVKDTTYYLALDGAAGARGALSLAWSVVAASTPQTLAFSALADIPRDAAPFQVFAYSDSGLPVTVTVVSGPAVLDGDMLAPTGSTGTVRLRATQAGDAVYLPATLEATFAVRAAPTNDAFANALTLGTTPVSGSNLFATAEALDPFPASHSIWWRYTATATGELTLDTAGSAISTTLTVLTGTSPANFETVIADTRPGVRALVKFPVTAGVTYHVAVDSLDGQGAVSLAVTFTAPSLPQTITFEPLPDVGLDAAPFYLSALASSELPVVFALDGATPAATLVDGFLSFTGNPGVVKIVARQPGNAYYAAATPVTRSFTVRPPPANDTFASAPALAGKVVVGSNIDATAEALDPFPASHSVWWRYTATATGVLTLDTAASAIPTTLTVLTGASLADAQIVASDTRAGVRARLEVPVATGLTYRIAVDAFDNQQGALSLAWSFARPSRPQTITFNTLPNLTAGDPAFTPVADASSGLPVTITLVSGPATLKNGVLTLTNLPGTVKLVATQPGDAYYTAAPAVTRTFTVAKPPAIKFTFSDLKQTYDGSRRAITATTSAEPRYANLVVTYSGPGYPASTDAPFAAGTYTVVATADASRATTKLVIEKAPLTVTALDARKLAGQDNPPFSLSYTGFQAQDNLSAVSKAPVAKTAATKTSPGKAGGYPITVSGGASANYRFVFVPGTLQVDTFAGRYEALLTDDTTQLPVAKLELTIASSGSAFTGALHLPTEPAAVVIKGALALDSSADTASVVLPIKTKTQLYSLTLLLPLQANLPPHAGFTASLTHGGQPFGATTAGRAVFIPATNAKLLWAGAHTALLRDAVTLDTEPPVFDHPRGTGHALATIDAKGNLKLAGTLADGSPLTATLAPDVSGTYRLFARPHATRLQSQIIGVLPLVEHPDIAPRRYLPASAGQSVYWTKAALPATTKTPDKSYRDGFGPLGLTVTIDPWLPPVVANPKAKPPIPAITLANLLDLATNSAGGAAFVPDFGPDDLDLGQLVNPLPTALSLSAGNLVTVTAPITNPVNSSKFTLKVVPTTGAFSGGFTLSDRVPAPTKLDPTATKIVPRPVTFTGVLRQAPADDESAVFGAGYFLVPAMPGATNTSQPSGEIRLLRP